jgi:site-specific DNA recombinase
MVAQSVPQPRALVYLRVSSAKQEDGYSLATQEEGCRRYCEERGYEIVETFREVFTGTEIEHRPQLRALRDRLRRGDIAVVLCYDPDRASRAGLGPSLYLRESVKLAGARLEYVLKTYSDDLSGDLLYAIDSWRAAEEVEKIRERTQRGRRARIEGGKPLAGGRPIYGYRWTDAGKSRLEPDPATAPVAIRIFAAIAGGGTLGALARALTVEGVPAPAHSEDRPIRAWNITTLHTMLKNPAYMGRPVAHRWRTVVENGKRRRMLRDPAEVVPLPAGMCPALVDDRTWLAVQAVLVENRHKTEPRHEHPTTHLLRGGYAVCGYCQNRLYPVSPRKATERWGPAPPSYRCSSYQRGTGCARCVTMSAPLLDRLVWAKVAGLLADPAVLAEELERRRQHDPTEADLEAADRTLAGLAAQRRNYIDNLGFVSGQAAALIAGKLAEIERDEARLTAERAAIVRRRRTWQAAQVRLEDLQRWCRRAGADLDHLTFDERRDVLHVLNVRAAVFKPGHSPRIVIEAEVPLNDGESAAGDGAQSTSNELLELVVRDHLADVDVAARVDPDGVRRVGELVGSRPLGAPGG